MRGKDQPWEKEVMDWVRAETPKICDDLKAAGAGPATVGEELHLRFDAWYAMRRQRLDDRPDPHASTLPFSNPPDDDPRDTQPTRRTRRPKSSSE